MSSRILGTKLSEAGQQHRCFFVETRRTDPGGNQIRKTSRVRFGVTGGPLPENVKFGMRIQAGQTIMTLTIGGHDLNIPSHINETVQGELMDTFGGTDQEWKGFVIPKAWVPNTSGIFRTVFRLDGFMLMSPEFQVVPLLFALAESGSFGTGHYIAGASVLTGKHPDDPADPSPARGRARKGKGAKRKTR